MLHFYIYCFLRPELRGKRHRLVGTLGEGSCPVIASQSRNSVQIKSEAVQVDLGVASPAPWHCSVQGRSQMQTQSPSLCDQLVVTGCKVPSPPPTLDVPGAQSTHWEEGQPCLAPCRNLSGGHVPRCWCHSPGIASSCVTGTSLPVGHGTVLFLDIPRGSVLRLKNCEGEPKRPAISSQRTPEQPHIHRDLLACGDNGDRARSHSHTAVRTEQLLNPVPGPIPKSVSLHTAWDSKVEANSPHLSRK